VREAVGDDFPILGKMGLTDGVKNGLQEDEAVEVAATPRRRGDRTLSSRAGVRAA